MTEEKANNKGTFQVSSKCLSDDKEDHDAGNDTTHSPHINNNTNNGTPTQICKRFETIYNSMLSLRKHTNMVKESVCSLLGKPDISSVSATDIKTSNKLSKQILGDHILKSIELSDALCAPESLDSFADLDTDSSSLKPFKFRRYT